MLANKIRDYLYHYEVKEVEYAYDGDTVTFVVSLGFDIDFKITTRLLGIDTPELRGAEREEGLVVRDYVRKLLAEAEDIVIQTHKDRTGKYGRYLATVFVDGMNLNQHLLETGRARAYPDAA